MAKAQCSTLETRDAAQHVKLGAGAQLVLKRHMQARWTGMHRGTQTFTFTDQIQKIPGRIGKPIEIVGNGEVLNDVAFPGVDDAAVGLDPVSHRCFST
jgi:hypothetical protein